MWGGTLLGRAMARAGVRWLSGAFKVQPKRPRLAWLAAGVLATLLALPGVAAAGDASLGMLVPSVGALTPAFDPATTSYTISVSATDTDISFNPILSDPSGSVTVGGVAATSGAMSSPVALPAGATTNVDIVVTATDMTTQTYTVAVTRPSGGALSTNANLANLALSAGALTPSFASSTTSYTASVSHATTSITVTPTLADSTATLSVNGSSATSGAAVGPIALNVGANVITVVTTAEDGVTTKSYSVTVTRAAAASQTITFNNPGAQNFGTTPTLTATATSSLTVSFSSSTTGVCTITSGGTLAFVTAGTCTINANQAGDSNYDPAPTVSQSFAVNAVVPGAPTIGNATAGDSQASVSFAAPAANGGASITGYTVTSSPGGFTGSGASSPLTVSGLTNGVSYTFTVTATNSAGTGAASSASNAATPGAPQTITFANPGAQNFGTAPTLTATATSNLTVSFTSATTGVCTITTGGALTFVATGTCTINADQAGGSGYLAASQVIRSFSVNAVVPGAPTIGAVTPGNGQASVAFTAPAFTGGAAITSYTVTSSPGGFTGTGASSPITVSGLTNGVSYTFSVTATNTAGTGAASSASSAATPSAPSTDATLSALALSSGTLSPSFAAGTTSYTASAANAVSSITVTPTVNESHATVKVNGTTVTSGSPSGAIALAVGANTITVLVTAQDGTTTQTYTVTVTRAAAPPPALSNNANLSEMAYTVDGARMVTPAFDAATTSYAWTVPGDATYIQVAATAADTNAQVRINEVIHSSGEMSSPIILTGAGPFTITVRVIAQDGTTTKTYTITVTREPAANNADLSGVQICSAGAGCSSPSFDPATTAYTIQAVGSFQIKPTTADPGATVTVNGAAVTSGTASAAFTAPATALTPVAVTVTSRDKSTTKTYTFTFGPPKPSADLSGIGVSAGALSPAFDPATTSYSVTVSSDTQTITLTPTAKDPAATIAAQTLLYNQPASGPVLLVAGGTTSITVTVVATDNTRKTYFVNVVRASPLEVFSPSNQTTKVGTAWVGNYYVRSFHDLNWTSTDLPPGLTLAPTPRTSTMESKADITGTPTKAGTYSFTVTAKDPTSGASGSVTQTLTVVDGASDVDLTKLNVTTPSGDLPLSPVFDPAVTSYTATTTDDSITTVGLPRDGDASVTINGKAPEDGNYKLALGDNVFAVTVTKGPASKTYTLTVTRVAPHFDVNLKSLSLGAGAALSPAFAPDTLSYETKVANDVASLPITAAPSDPTALLSTDGGAATSPINVPLNVGQNVIHLTVTEAQKRVSRTYTLTVTRAASANADLSSLSIIALGVTTGSASALSPSFSAGTTSYTMTATHDLSQVFVSPVSADSKATLKMNGGTIASGASRAVELADGANTITVESIAPDGVTTKTYTVTITRAGPALTIPSDILPSGQVGQAYSASLSVLGGTGPYTFALARVAGGGDLPKGLSLSADGKLTGKPASEGPYTVGVTATDSKGATGTGTVTVLILGQITSVTVSQTLSVTITPGLSSQNSDTLKLNLANEVSTALSVSPSRLAATYVTPGAAPAASPTASSAFAGKGSGGPLSVVRGQAAASGSDPVLSYTPYPNAMGLDRIVVTGVGLDGAPTAVALNIQVPGKAPDLTASVAANGFVRLDPIASVVGGPFMGLKILAPPAYGQVSVSGLQLVYIPDPTHLGPTTFVYAVDLGFGLSAPGEVTVTTGQAVTAPSLSAKAYAGQKVSLDLTTGAQGAPFTAANVVSISPSNAGAAVIRSTGAGTYALDFTPTTSFTGTATVTYGLAGAGGGYAQADATITVLARPDPSLDADLRGLISASDQAVRTFARTQTDNFNGRLESLRSGRGHGGFDFRLGLAAPSSGEDPRDQDGWRLRRLARQDASDPTGATPASGQHATDAPSAAPGAPGKPSAFGSWVAGTIQIGHVDGATQRRDYRLSTSGLSAGVDYRLSDHLVLGAGLGYGEDKAKVGSKGSRLDGESKVGAAYGAWLPRPGVFVDGVLGYGRLSFDVTRYSAEADKLLTGSRSGDMTFGSLRAGYEGRRGALLYSPYGQVSFLDGRLDSFTETGDAAFALRYYDQDVRSLAATLGLKLEGRTKVGRERTLSPRFRVEWRHEFDGVGDQALSYADMAGSQRYVVTGDQLGRDELSYELGGRLQLEHQFSIDLGYRGMFSNSMRSETWTLKLDHSF